MEVKNIKEEYKPVYKGCLTDFETSGSQNALNELQDKFTVELSIHDSKLLDEVISEVSNIEVTVPNQEYAINSKEIKDEVLKILSERFKKVDIVSIPLMTEKEINSTLSSFNLIKANNQYFVKRLVPYELLQEDTANLTDEEKKQFDISKTDWFSSVMTDLIKYYDLSVAEAYGRHGQHSLPFDTTSKTYATKFNQFYRTLIAIIREKAELHTYIDSAFAKQMFLFNKGKSKSLHPFITTLYSEKSRTYYHTYCKYWLSYHRRIPNSKVTLADEQSIPPLIKGNWVVYLNKKVNYSFNKFLSAYSKYKAIGSFYDTLQYNVDTYHNYFKEEVNQDFLNKVEMVSIPQFDILRALVDTVLSFPREIWRGIDWTDKAIQHFDEEAFHHISYNTDGEKAETQINSEYSPFINSEKACKYAFALFSKLFWDAYNKNLIADYKLYLPILKDEKISSYEDLCKVKDYIFTLHNNELYNRLYNIDTEIKTQDLLESIRQIRNKSNSSLLTKEDLSKFEYTIYDDNYDWEAEYNYIEDVN